MPTNSSACLVVCATVVVSSLALRESEARACAPLLCDQAVPAATSSTPIPANAPALFLQPAIFRGIDSSGDASIVPETATDAPAPAKAILRGPTGTEVPFVADWSLLKLSAPLALGEHTLQFTTCDRSSGSIDASVVFTVGASQPLPTQAVPIAATEGLGPILVPGSFGPCEQTVVGRYVDLTPTLGAEHVPWASLLRYETRVDGQVWARSLPGRQESSLHEFATPQARRWNRLFRNCEPAASEAWSPEKIGLSAGPHTVEVIAMIPGAPPLPTTTLSIMIPPCPVVGPGDGGLADVGVDATPDGRESVRGDANADAPTHTDAIISPDSPALDADVGDGGSSHGGHEAGVSPAGGQDSSGGCSFGTSNTLDASWVLMALGGLAHTVRRRTPRRRNEGR